jgi:16S rRNA (guanine1516-N2)-methyltransferase
MKIFLHKTPEHLELRAEGPDAPGAVYVDFLSGKQAHRRRFGGGRRQLIGRAVGVKPNQTLRVLDVTAGLGRDAYVLACLGCEVLMIERSKEVVALLKDGLVRGKKDADFAALSLSLIEADARDYLCALSDTDRPDIVYLDPMFPASKKSALVKKEMRILKYVVGEDDVSEEMLTIALKTALKRVVVKRPRYAQSIEGLKPDVVFTGKSSRFDVYLCV